MDRTTQPPNESRSPSIGTPPTRQIEQASGVSDVQVDGQIVRCLVYGSFQPFLEAMRGYEVISLTAIPVPIHVRRTT